MSTSHPQQDALELEMQLADAFDAVSPIYSVAMPHEVADIVARALQEVVDADGIGIYLYDINDDVMRRVAERPAERFRPLISIGVGLVGRALTQATERALVLDEVDVENAEWDEPAPTDPEPDRGAGVVRSVCTRGHLRAGIVLTRDASRASFTQLDARIVDYIAERLADALESIRAGVVAR